MVYLLRASPCQFMLSNRTDVTKMGVRWSYQRKIDQVHLSFFEVGTISQGGDGFSNAPTNPGKT